jgi:transposase InsO family protein
VPTGWNNVLQRRLISNHVVLLGEQHLRTVLREYVAHYHTERNHQGLGNRLVAPLPAVAIAEGAVQLCFRHACVTRSTAGWQALGAAQRSMVPAVA